MTSVVISKSTNPKKKYMARFAYDDGKKKTLHFGAKGYKDNTMADTTPEQKKAYLARHKKNENWEKFDTAGSLSKHLLWGDSKSLDTNIKAFKKKFNLK